MASLCEADGIAYRRAPRRSQIVSNYYRYEQINKKYTKELFKAFQIGSLASLSATDILEIRKNASKLRAKIDSLLCTKVLPFEVADDDVIAECGKLFAQYAEYIRNLVREKTTSRIILKSGKDVAVTIVGLWLPILSIIPFGESFVSWFRGKDKNGFVLYMMELQEIVKGVPSVDGGVNTN